jgi:hypothetical protein
MPLKYKYIMAKIKLLKARCARLEGRYQGHFAAAMGSCVSLTACLHEVGGEKILPSREVKPRTRSCSQPATLLAGLTRLMVGDNIFHKRYVRWMKVRRLLMQKLCRDAEYKLYLRMTVFWDVAPCSLVEVPTFQRFLFPPRIRLRGATCKKTAIFKLESHGIHFLVRETLA